MAKRFSALPLTSKYLALVEGKSDDNFLRALLAQRGIPDFQVIAPGEVADNLGGAAAFRRVLNYLPMLTGFDKVDDKPDDSFAKVLASIQAAEEFGEPLRKYPVPGSPQEKAAGKPAVVVYMIPETKTPGNLEALCLRAAAQPHQELMQCVDDLLACAGVAPWIVTKQAKARVRAFLAIAHPDRPDISLPAVWSDCPHLFPIESNALDDLARFLQQFPQRIAEQ